MRWLKLLERYGLNKKPVLRAVNPRQGTCIIPLDKGDEAIFFQYLQDKGHALFFDGSESELKRIINDLRVNQGITVQKMSMSEGRADKVMNLHIRLADFQEIRRVIKLR